MRKRWLLERLLKTTSCVGFTSYFRQKAPLTIGRGTTFPKLRKGSLNRNKDPRVTRRRGGTKYVLGMFYTAPALMFVIAGIHSPTLLVTGRYYFLADLEEDHLSFGLAFGSISSGSMVLVLLLEFRRRSLFKCCLTPLV